MSGAIPADAGRVRSPAVRVLHHFEDALAGVALALMFVLPLAEIVLRRVAGTGIPGSIPFVQHLVLWVGFLGAALAAREGTMLALATGTFLPPGRAREWAGTLAATVAAAVSMMLAVGAYELVMSEREAGTVIAAGITTWMAQTVLPFAFALIALRTVWTPSLNADPARDCRLRPRRRRVARVESRGVRAGPALAVGCD